ncbi:cell division protein FtsL [sulfur-oxidizing endosymbiont of Gigantopelta aegis]|uniref:cell division protein FtsL n=1 Tax=sulfur-oxidizing endosymbiont of Gigantopelta aegis TaxID=2794934 RepID=UPI0018DB3048|nr:cell division protein FtsL [sulfur-oxidizing endosymbiont of Gigantopelta aegis]
MSGKVLFILILLIVTFVSAISVVYVKHYNRKLFVELQQLEKQRDDMDVEWGQLQLEQNTWATHTRIERIAKQKLQMITPKTSDVIYIQQTKNELTR